MQHWDDSRFLVVLQMSTVSIDSGYDSLHGFVNLKTWNTLKTELKMDTEWELHARIETTIKCSWCRYDPSGKKI